MSEPQRYPLSWPDQWPRVPAGRRQTSRFGLRTVPQAFAELQHEMRRLASTSKDWFMSSNVRRNQNGSPTSVTARLFDPGVAVYFTYAGRPTSFACDKWLHVEDNIYAIAKTIEALRGIERWGSSEMIERSFRGYAALPAPGESGGGDWWRTLGVAVNADAEAVRFAYTTLCKKHHPDVVGGSAEMFRRVQEAWEKYQELVTA